LACACSFPVAAAFVLSTPQAVSGFTLVSLTQAPFRDICTTNTRSRSMSELYHVQPFALQLLRPLLTSCSTESWCRPFRHKAGSPRVRTQSFLARPPDLRRLTVDHESFAVSGPLALVGAASYPVFVHRPASLIRPSSPRLVTLPKLGFTSFAVVSLREDLHLQDCARAGRTKKTRSFSLRVHKHVD
jgi:hypothetical protein